MLTPELQKSLLQEVAESSPESPKYLMALVEMGRFKEDERRLGVMQRFRRYAIPLLQQPEPKFEAVAPFGAMLLAHPERPESPEELLDYMNFCGYDNDDTLLVWITSTQTPKQLAAHLNRFSFAEDEHENRYLLRYYAPRITPILQRFAPETWVKDFFAPIISWWYSVATPQGETWQRIAGGGQDRTGQNSPGTAPVTLLMTDELQDALMQDTLPHHVLQTMLQALPELPKTLSDTDCYGVRLARVEEALDKARQKGLNQEEDLIAYAYITLQTPALATDTSWQNAVQNAAQGKTPLNTWQSQG
jgi:hypothetical protein